MNIDREQIKHIADLANLTINENELDKYTNDMSNIVEFATKLNELDTENVEITTSILGEFNIFREDELKESFDNQELLKNAPASQDGMFKIPKVIGG